MEHDIPMALHLDHGPDFETCKACIDGGFTSVMIDGSPVRLREKRRDYQAGSGIRP